jgi:hypothetical protein
MIYRKYPMANVKNTIICLITALICGVAPARADSYGACDSGVFGIMDKHFQGVLFPEAYKSLASAKIAYPGLWTSEKNSVTAGLLPDVSGAGWRGLYSWADISNGPGNAGVWLGNLNIAEEYRHYYTGYDRHYADVSGFSLRGAAWITPFRGNLFRGLSVTVDIDNAFYYDGNEEWEYLDTKRFFINLTSLIRISDNYHLRAGIRTYNKIAEDDPSAGRFDNSKLYTDGVYIGLIDDKRRTLELRADNTFGMLYSWEKTDTLSFSLQYTQGGALSYQKHILFLGLKADAGAAFISRIGEETGSFAYTEYLRNLTTDGWITRVNVSVPVVLDVSVYGPLRCMLSIVPRASYTRFNYPRQAQYEFAMALPDAELSLRGTVGDRFDFALKPTVSNDVFMSEMEVRYRF